MNADGSVPGPAPIKVPVCSGLRQTGTNWNLEVPFRTTRLRGSLPIGRAQVCPGFLYRALKHTYKPRMGGMFIAKRIAQSANPRRGDMFIAKRIAQSAKPRRGDMFVARCAAGFAKPLPQGHDNHPCRSYGAWRGIRGDRGYKHGAPSGAGNSESWFMGLGLNRRPARLHQLLDAGIAAKLGNRHCGQSNGIATIPQSGKPSRLRAFAVNPPSAYGSSGLGLANGHCGQSKASVGADCRRRLHQWIQLESRPDCGLSGGLRCGWRPGVCHTHS